MTNLQTVSGGSGPSFVRHIGIPAPLLLRNVDSDVIAPVNPNSISGLSRAERAFEPLRYFSDGRENPDFVLNQEIYRNASILLVGENFGTGSARGTAVSLPMAMGFRVVIGPSFGPMFYANSIQQGMLAVPLGEEVVTRIADWAVANPWVEMLVDLERNVIEAPGLASISFRINPRVRNKFLLGLSTLDEMLEHAEEATEVRNEAQKERPWVYANPPGANR